MSNWKVQIKDSIARYGKDIFIYRNIGGKTEIYHSDETVTIFDEGSAIDSKPTIYLDDDMLQQLADLLDKNGFKPQKGFIEGKLESTENHLEDMRRLVFKNHTPQGGKE